MTSRASTGDDCKHYQLTHSLEETDRRRATSIVTWISTILRRVSTVTPTLYSLVGKRCLDASCALLGLVLLSPVLCLAALAVRITSPGPVFFRQARLGQFGRPFRIFKFRTMVVNNGADGSLLTASGDPRITRVGRWLRATKLDELAQLLNVLRGEMSLVGPRPEVPDYVAFYTERQRQVLLVKPGVTGPAASMYEEELLAGQPDKEHFYLTTVLPAKLETDIAYCKNVQCLSDLKLILRTIAKVAVRIGELCRLPVSVSQKEM
jgi:lipopolysaccharide/colanic/teichoic acid biosynthesis glycosyltransferase